MARRRRSYRGLVSLPSLGNATAILKYDVKAQDMMVGAGAALVGSGALKWAANKFLVKADGTSYLPAFVHRFWPLVSGIATGAALYYAQKDRQPSRARAHLVGAVTAGAVLSAWDALKAAKPEFFNDLVALRLPYNGLIVNDPNRALSDANLSALAAVSMGDDASAPEIDELMDY